MQMSLSRLFWTVSSIFAIGLTLGVAPVHAQPPAKDVVVINTPAEPVPVTLQGTSSVTGNVAVTNTPTVIVGNQVTVRDDDRPTKQPVSIAFSAPTTSGGGFQFWSTATLYTVPAGKRLVVEDVDAEAIVTPSNNTGSVRGNLEAFSGSKFFTHPIGTTKDAVQCSLTQTCFSLSRATRLYFDAGSQLSFTASGNLGLSGGFHAVRGNINGYLVDEP